MGLLKKIKSQTIQIFGLAALAMLPDFIPQRTYTHQVGETIIVYQTNIKPQTGFEMESVLTILNQERGTIEIFKTKGKRIGEGDLSARILNEYTLEYPGIPFPFITPEYFGQEIVWRRGDQNGAEVLNDVQVFFEQTLELLRSKYESKNN